MKKTRNSFEGYIDGKNGGREMMASAGADRTQMRTAGSTTSIAASAP